jgi:hypothetical protein
MFPDEWGSTVLASGLHENAVAGAAQNGEVTAANPLVDASVAVEPEISTDEAKKLPAGGHTDVYRIFKPSGFGGGGTAKITLLFSPSPLTYRRHGVRKFFESYADRILINVPGVEKTDAIYATVGRKHPWGVGITKTIIDDLFSKVGLGGTPWQIDVMSGYSTGFRGLNGTINNSVNPLNTGSKPGLLDLSKVTMVVYNDAFYIGDEHPPGECTWRALTTLDTATGKNVRVGVYDVTDGTPHKPEHLALHKKLGGVFNTTSGARFAIIDVRSSTEAMFGLMFARMLDAAIKDKYCPANVLPTSLQNLITSIAGIPRGSFRSPIPASFRRFSTSSTELTAWGKANAKDVAAFDTSKRTDVWKTRVLPYNLMGWQPRGIDSMLHDGYIPEFGWELLAG